LYTHTAALGSVSYSSESSLPTKPPTPASRPTPVYSTYSRRLVSKTRPTTPRYQSCGSTTRSPSTSSLLTTATTTTTTLPSPVSAVTPRSYIPGASQDMTSPRSYLPAAVQDTVISTARRSSIPTPGSLAGFVTSSAPTSDQDGSADKRRTSRRTENCTGAASPSPRETRGTPRRGESPGGGRHTARRAESPRHSTCKNNSNTSSNMQIFSPTSTSVRQNWLNSNILNNNQQQLKSGGVCDSSDAASSSGASSVTSGKAGGKSGKGGSNTLGKTSTSNSKGAAIFRAISVGRINNSKQDKYYSTRDGTLCISLHK